MEGGLAEAISGRSILHPSLSSFSPPSPLSLSLPHLAVSLVCHDVRRDAIEEPAVVRHTQHAAGKVVDGLLEAAEGVHILQVRGGEEMRRGATSEEWGWTVESGIGERFRGCEFRPLAALPPLASAQLPPSFPAAHQVVGRLVQQQQVARLLERLCQVQPVALPARELPDLFLLVDALEVVPRAVGARGDLAAAQVDLKREGLGEWGRQGG